MADDELVEIRFSDGSKTEVRSNLVEIKGRVEQATDDLITLADHRGNDILINARHIVSVRVTKARQPMVS